MFVFYKNWLVRLASEVERDIVSVERIVHYAKELPSEAPRELIYSKPPAGWPGAGEVEFWWVNASSVCLVNRRYSRSVQ